MLLTPFQSTGYGVEHLRTALGEACVESEKCMPPMYIGTVKELRSVSRVVGLFVPSTERQYQEDQTLETRNQKQLKVRPFCRSLPEC
ncbi:hypothetical protein M404DRAFT_1007645 [Pisolithus tinctorius Marx 270]|uniref:Uncharacterized protein n=1 Tax=Pisolithus tinctorius Marx 270 TaxID=870435 RepID=A0A0C3JCH8_PISTI|nr:hypothetical protein M404DRAFT_1007645 [Pisolithus tinctorius Marx 270]